jgi:hypothetical protein
MVPRRYQNAQKARELFGDHADLYGDYLMIGDPLADAVVETFKDLDAKKCRQMLNTALEQGIDKVRNPPLALVRFFEEVDRVPLWVDWAKIDRDALGITSHVRCAR